MYIQTLFTLIYACLSLLTKERQKKRQEYIKSQEDPENSNVKTFLTSLPCCGIFILLLTGISIISTVMISPENSLGDPVKSFQSILHITIYISFSLSGIVDILIFYKTKNIHPQIQLFSIVLAFLVEFIAVFVDKDEGRRTSVSFCLELAIFCCLVTAVMNILSDGPITPFSLMVFTQIQGTWLIHSRFLKCSDKMAYIYFSWHILGVFTSSFVINVLEQWLTTSEVKTHIGTKHTDHTTTVAKITGHSEVYKGLSVVDHEIVKEALNNGEREVGDDDLNNSIESVPTAVISVPSDLCERMSPLEEFNTLHRHTDTVRKSLRIKESSIV